MEKYKRPPLNIKEKCCSNRDYKIINTCSSICDYKVYDLFENTLIDNTTKTDIIDIVVWGFVLAVIVGVLGYVIRSLRGRG